MKIKITTILICITVLYISCINQEKNTENLNKAKNEISNLLDNWHKNAANFNHESYISAISKDGIYIGTDAGEIWTTAEFNEWTKPYFERKSTWNFRKLQRNIYLDSQMQFAWFDELLETAMGICRGSGVLKLEENTWKIKHYVLSATIPNDLMKQVIELKHQTDSVSMLMMKSFNR